MILEAPPSSSFTVVFFLPSFISWHRSSRFANKKKLFGWFRSRTCAIRDSGVENFLKKDFSKYSPLAIAEIAPSFLGSPGHNFPVHCIQLDADFSEFCSRHASAKLPSYISAFSSPDLVTPTSKN